VISELDKAEQDFHIKYGSLFSLDATIEYCQALHGHYAEIGNKYAKNKCAETEATCEKLKSAIERELTNGLNQDQKRIALEAVEYHKSLVYDFFSLDAQEQRRVRGLLDKIKKERGINP
jgi:hypothetical protein